MRRRLFLAAASLTAAPARAQAPPPRVGFLVAGDPEPTWGLFRKAMTGLGLVDGKSVAYEFRSADTPERLDAAAKELVTLKVDVIVSVLSPATAAATRATSTIPIVFNGGGLITGVVTNMARPEGNLTGAFAPGPTVAAKGLQLFHEMLPQTKAVGLLLNATDPFRVPLLREVEATSRAENIELVPVLMKPDDAPAGAFTTLAGRQVDGVLVQPSLGMKAIAATALQARLPAFSFRREFAEVGGLFSYGADQAEINRAIASQVERILKGAKPSDLPVQQATKFELVINRKTAMVLGLTLPPLLVAGADEVID